MKKVELEVIYLRLGAVLIVVMTFLEEAFKYATLPYFDYSVIR